MKGQAEKSQAGKSQEEENQEGKSKAGKNQSTKSQAAQRERVWSHVHLAVIADRCFAELPRAAPNLVEDLKRFRITKQ